MAEKRGFFDLVSRLCNQLVLFLRRCDAGGTAQNGEYENEIERTLMKAVAAVGWRAGLLAIITTGTAFAQPPEPALKIGLLTDFSSVYSHAGGIGDLEAAKMAIEDFGGLMFGKPIEFVSADALNKPDVAAAIASKWWDTEGVDMIVGFPTSATALAVMEMSKLHEKIMIVTSAASSDITGKFCAPDTAHWTYDTYGNAHTGGNAIVKRGGDSWFFITADYVFGQSVERDTSDVVKAAGGNVLGSVKHPLNAVDFSSLLVQAQASKAKVIGLANAGGDAVNAIKQAAEFNIPAGGQTLAAMAISIADIHGLGLKLGQGLIVAAAYYWDLNAKTRAFGKRFLERGNRMPSMVNTGAYSATLHYLRAVNATGTRHAKTVMAKMREMPVRDAFTENGVLREDGRMMHSMYLFEVKTPEESQGPWDYYTLLADVPADQAFRPLKDGGCPLVR